MSNKSLYILVAILFLIAMCNAALAITVMPLGAHWLIWGLPLVSSVVDVVAAVILLVQLITHPEPYEPRIPSCKNNSVSQSQPQSPSEN